MRWRAKTLFQRLMWWVDVYKRQEYRAAHGPFASVEELALINGISDETVQAAKEVAVALPPKPGVQ